MKGQIHGITDKARNLNRVTRQICITLIGALILSSCSAYRAERLKNKSYKEWKARQSNDKSLQSNNNGAQAYSFEQQDCLIA